MSGPPAGAGKPSPEQIAMFKEAGIRKIFIADISGGLGPYVMGSVIPFLLIHLTDHQICLQFDHAWNLAISGMALGLMDQGGETSYQSYRRTSALRTVWFNADVQWVVTFFSFASTVFCMVWFYQLFVVHYGKFSQFVDNTCMSLYQFT